MGTEKVENENHNLRGGSREPKEEQRYDDDEEEYDPEVLARREKQLDTFKRSIDYRTYLESMSKKSRPRRMPGTPEKKRKFSRRAWDGAVRQWKLRVHAESRKVMENSSSKTTRSNSDFKSDRRSGDFEDGNIDNKTNEDGVDDMGQNIAEEGEGASGTAGDIMEVKLEYKTVEEEEPLDPAHLKEEKEEEVVETGKSKKEKVNIITI